MSPPVLEFASAMPSAETLAIQPISQLLRLFAGKGDGWADPFGGRNSPAQHQNDVNHQHHLEAAVFLGRFPDEFLQGVILDSISKPRQIMESGSGQVMDVASKKIVPGGLVVCCGRDSNGLGTKRGFELIHVLDVQHGGDHNDTFVTVEIKVPYQAADDPTADDLAALGTQEQRRVGKESSTPLLPVAQPARGRGETTSSSQVPSHPLRLREVVRVSGRSASTIRRAIKDGLLQVHKVGRGKRRPTYEIHAADLQRYIEASRVESPDPPSIPTVKVRRKSRHFD